MTDTATEEEAVRRARGLAYSALYQLLESNTVTSPIPTSALMRAVFAYGDACFEQGKLLGSKQKD